MVSYRFTFVESIFTGSEIYCLKMQQFRKEHEIDQQTYDLLQEHEICFQHYLPQYLFTDFKFIRCLFILRP